MSRYAPLLLSAMCWFGAVAPAWSQPLTARIRVEAPFQPEAAHGLIFSRRGVIEKPKVDHRELSPGVFVVSFPIEDRENTADRFATAVVLGPEGAIAFGSSVPVGMAVETPDFAAIPDCGPEVRGFAVEGQDNLLDRLVSVRNAKIELGKQEIAALLDEALVARIEKLERGFGLSRTKPIGPGTDPRQIADRVSRLVLAIDNYEAHRRKAVSSPEE